MRLVTANIKSVPRMRQSRVNSDVSRVSKLGNIILWQEIEPRRYKDALRRLMPTRTHVALGTETPISYQHSTWHQANSHDLPDLGDAPRDLFPHGVKTTGEIRMHGGRRRVSPTRYLTYAILVDGYGPPVVWMNTHMISGAWSRRHMWTRAWRRRMWWIHFKKQRRVVLYFRSKGLTVVGGGDLNRRDVPKFHKSQRWLAHGGIDHLYCVQAPGGARIILKETRVVRGLNTDHSPRVATLLVRPPVA